MAIVAKPCLLVVDDEPDLVQSVKDRLRQGFNVSVAEVDDLDQRQLATLGVALVGHEAYAVRTTLEKIVEALSAGRW